MAGMWLKTIVFINSFYQVNDCNPDFWLKCVIFQESPQPVTSSPAPQESPHVHKPVPSRPHRPHAPSPQYQEPVTALYPSAAQPVIPQQQSQAQPAFLQSIYFKHYCHTSIRPRIGLPFHQFVHPFVHPLIQTVNATVLIFDRHIVQIIASIMKECLWPLTLI